MYQEYLNQVQMSIAPMTSDELKDLLNNEDKLDEKCEEVLEALKSQKENLLTENRSKAEKNIEKEPEIIEMRGRLQELHDEGKTCCEAVQEKLALIKDKSGNVNQETALALLQTAAAESEEETEALIKQFTDSDIGVEAFLETFLETRKAMHLRKLKAEKMQELMRRQVQTGQRIPNTTGGYSNFPTSGFFSMPSTGSGGTGVPYPIGPMMPMPPPRPY